MPFLDEELAHDLAEEASTVDEEMFRETLHGDAALLRKVPSLVRLEGPTMSPVVIVGDLHGDLMSALAAVDVAVMHEAEGIVFLGDYVDRGPSSIEVMWLALGLWMRHPDKVVLLRGNHETEPVAGSYGLLAQLEERGMEGLFKDIVDVFSWLPMAAVVEGRMFAAHGGIPTGEPTLSDIRAIKRGDPDPAKDPALGLLWYDPDEKARDFEPNPSRGVGRSFGHAVVKDFLDRAGLACMVRSHQPVLRGHHVMFDGLLHSIFSCRTYGTCLEPRVLLARGTGKKGAPSIETIRLPEGGD
jgi:diadenosine tetraphosphatase ApaH/serine/threonine PP2A family protein phosphatase